MTARASCTKELDLGAGEFLYRISMGSGLGSNPVGIDRGQLRGTGTWTGNATFDGVAISFVWQLRESAGVIAGSASFTIDPTTVTGDVTGSYIHPDVRMTLVVHFEPGDTLEFRWVGTRTSDDFLSGVLHDPGGGQTSMTLLRG